MHNNEEVFCFWSFKWKHWMYNNLSLNRCFCCKAISKGENPAWPSVDNGHENGWAMELVEKSKPNVSSWNLRDIPGAPSFRKLKEQAVSSSSSSRYQSERLPSRSSAARSWTYQAWKLKRSIFYTCKNFCHLQLLLKLRDKHMQRCWFDNLFFL
jgi:hypothetical protein